MGEMLQFKVKEGAWGKVKGELSKISHHIYYQGEITHYFINGGNLHYVLEYPKEELTILEFKTPDLDQKSSKQNIISLALGQVGLNIKNF